VPFDIAGAAYDDAASGGELLGHETRWRPTATSIWTTCASTRSSLYAKPRDQHHGRPNLQNLTHTTERGLRPPIKDIHQERRGSAPTTHNKSVLTKSVIPRLTATVGANSPVDRSCGGSLQGNLIKTTGYYLGTGFASPWRSQICTSRLLRVAPSRSESGVSCSPQPRVLIEDPRPPSDPP
jgi:hypothetical protein